jgi:(1->4)-alpha-D-glucan 1-alpha-D-glucosylmutase
VVGDELVLYGERRLPLAAGTRDLPLDELVELQHYVLTHWRSPRRNVRRFFTIDDLVAVRVEHPDVAAAVDTLPSRWASHPGFGGVRVDHVDGLADPLSYLTGLRARIGDDALLLVEKILAPGETLPASWPVDGTTGYEFIRAVDHLLLDPSSSEVLDDAWRAVSGDPRPYAAIEDESRREVLAGGLRPDLLRTIAAAERCLDDVPQPWVASAVSELTARLPRYRTYLPDDDAGRAVLLETADLARADVLDASTLDRVVMLLLDPADDAEAAVRTRWQQLTGPAMAKGAEDRAFYRYVRLASVSEVGGDPGELGTTPDDVHADQLHAQRSRPRTMLAGSTHDTKRSDDVRARSAALTWFARAWSADADAWAAALRQRVPGVDGATITLGLQTVVTCPGLDAERLAAYLVKAAREAELRTSWHDPDEAYERTLGALADALLDDPVDSDVAAALAAWSARLDGPGRRASIVATVLRCTCPGFPDVFQGTEVPAFRLVDPDNREPPDWEAVRRTAVRAAGVDLRGALASDEPDLAKPVVLQRLTALRRRRGAAFGVDAVYHPLHASTSVLAFARGDDVVAVAALGPETAGDAAVRLPTGTWRGVLSDETAALQVDDADADVAVVDVLRSDPVAVLERVD